MKKIAAFLVAAMLIVANASAQPLYSKTTEEIVTGGVSLKSIQRFYGDYALNINLVTADLKNKNLSFQLLKNGGGSDKVDTVANLAKTEENVVAAINADFFSAYKGDQNFSLGIEIKDGQLLQSHINSNMAAGFIRENALSFSYLSFSGEVAAPNGVKTALSHINKPTDYYGALLMYTPEFNGGVSPFLPEGITAVTVVDDTVTAKGVSLGGTIPIPADGYILVIDDNMTPFLEYNFNIGDEVELSVSTASLTEGVDTAFGGGTLLLSDGQKTEITHDVSGNNPRTAIGTNADGTVVYFLTVDGRQSVSRGVTLSELADICLEAGMVNAMNLDGGGSTAMVGKTLTENSLHTINAPTENRKVINAVAITTDAQSGEAAGFVVSAESDNVLSGDSIVLNLTAYDKNYNTPKTIPSDYEWKIAEGEGYVKDDVYYARGSGKTVLELYYNGKKTDSCEINVIDSVCGINAQSSCILTKGASVTLNDTEIFDQYGNTAKVRDLSLLNPQYDDTLISVNNNTVKALKEGAGNLTLSYGAASRSIKIVCGDYDADRNEAVTADNLYADNSHGFSLSILGHKPAETLFDRLIYARGMDLFRSSNACAVIGGGLVTDLTPGELSPFTAQGWGEYDLDNVKIVSLELSSKGVVQRGTQWEKLSAALRGAKQKNVIVLLDGEAAFVHDIDGAAFSQMLETASKDKNVFVVYNADENASKIKNGVRYISLADSKDEGTIKKTMENLKYLSFDITQDGATYCFKKLYN